MTLHRPVQRMPDDIAEALAEHRLRDAYDDRPAYQRNDYLGWIGRAKRPEIREKRISQMLSELGEGGVYMRMRHRPSERSPDPSKWARTASDPSRSPGMVENVQASVVGVGDDRAHGIDTGPGARL